MSEMVEGHANYDTFLVAMYSGNVRGAYDIRNQTFRRLTRRGRPMTPKTARVLARAVNAAAREEGLDKANLKAVDYDDLADTWETERQEVACNDAGKDWPC